MSTPTTVNDGGSAFPVAFIQGSDPYGADAEPGNAGMSLRAYFAGQALQGSMTCISNPDYTHSLITLAGENNRSVAEEIAHRSVRYADALIAELNKTQQ